MLVNCKDDKNPNRAERKTTVRVEVDVLISEKRKVANPMSRVLRSSTLRNPNDFKILGMVSLSVSADKDWGIMRSPDCIGE
jgi:hypothetical protein